MPIDLGAELTEWFRSPKTQDDLRGLMREAIRHELRAVLDEELLDTKQAAVVLNMSEAAIRKAVERGQIPCQRMGRRLKFRRSELLGLCAQREP